MVDFVLFGTGWRAEFYMRIADASPGFKLNAIYTRSEERRREIEKRGFKVFTSIEETLSEDHDLAVIASGNEGLTALLEKLRDREVIACETSFLKLADKELDYISTNIYGYALEQYWHTPLYASIKEALPLIGAIDSVYLSALHNHHAASIARYIFRDEKIKDIRTLSETNAKCIKTGSRAGIERGNEIQEYKRKITQIEYESGRIFINDFSSNQYHSAIIPSRIEIRGVKGIITERGVTYVQENGYATTLPFVFHRGSDKINEPMTLSHVTLGERTVFTNPFYPSLMNDDEIAIASMLKEIKEGKSTYNIKEAIEDAKLGKLL